MKSYMLCHQNTAWWLCFMIFVGLFSPWSKCTPKSSDNSQTTRVLISLQEHARTSITMYHLLIVCQSTMEITFSTIHSMYFVAYSFFVLKTQFLQQWSSIKLLITTRAKESRTIFHLIIFCQSLLNCLVLHFWFLPNVSIFCPIKKCLANESTKAGHENSQNFYSLSCSL